MDQFQWRTVILELLHVAPRFLANSKPRPEDKRIAPRCAAIYYHDNFLCVFPWDLLRIAILYTPVVAQNVIEIRMCLHLPILALDGPDLIFSLRP